MRAGTPAGAGVHARARTHHARPRDDETTTTPFGASLVLLSHPRARAALSFPRPRRFQPSTVRKICEEVITSELTGKTWNGEEEPVWTVRISEQIKARARGEY